MHIRVVTASYTQGFLMTKNPWLVFRLKHEISKQNFFEFSFLEKNHFIHFHIRKKMLILPFSYIYFYSMKGYDKHFFFINENCMISVSCQPGMACKQCKSMACNSFN